MIDEEKELGTDTELGEYFAIITEGADYPTELPGYVVKRGEKEYLRVLLVKGGKERRLLLEVIEG